MVNKGVQKVETLVLIVVVLVLMIGLSLLGHINRDTKEQAVSVLVVFNKGDSQEVKIRQRDKVTIYKIGEEEVVLTRVPRVGKERLAVPEHSIPTDTLQGRLPIREFTWELSYADSWKYIENCIQKENYVLERYVATSQYVEVYLKKAGRYKRLIVFRGTLMMGDMQEGVELPDALTYIEKYK